jgi:hypothetical protein
MLKKFEHTMLAIEARSGAAFAFCGPNAQQPIFDGKGADIAGPEIPSVKPRSPSFGLRTDHGSMPNLKSSFVHSQTHCAQREADVACPRGNEAPLGVWMHVR